MIESEDRALAAIVSAQNFNPCVLARAADIDVDLIRVTMERNAGTETAEVMAGLIASLLSARAQIRSLTED